MTISSIGAGQAAASAVTMAALATVATGSGNGGLIANVDAAASGVSSALQSLSGALGSIINTTA